MGAKQCAPEAVACCPSHGGASVVINGTLTGEHEGLASAALVANGPVEHVYESGAVYTGQWRGSLRDGEGAQRWPDGAKYSGQWLKDRATGRGRFEQADGDVYEGEWLDDKAHGYGCFYHAYGSRFEGRWVHDQQHGEGMEVWPDGAKYSGTFTHGRKTGKGSLGQMVRHVAVILWTTSFMAKGCTSGLMGEYTRASGSAIECMDRADFHGLTAEPTRASMQMTKRRVSGFSLGPTVAGTTANGSEENSTEAASTEPRRARIDMESGKMAGD